ncbi:MAG: EAL domain-containing protein [Lachnospiraceae bacterium]|nr:EAL domain-containing protein [Lachnospiraceae bacterium]
MQPKRIAVLIGQADEEYQADLLKGFFDRAVPEGIDVCVYSMYIKYQNSNEREIGESNIYRTLNYGEMDAILILGDTIQTPGLMKRIEDHLHDHYHGPLLCVDYESQYFPTVWTDGYQMIYEMITHLIRDHHKKDIAFLSGKKEHLHSQRRADAYRDAMEANGLTVSEDRIFYGDYWYSSGTSCAETLMESAKDTDSALPEAVACANDVMAIGLAEAFIREGVRIPEDILVTGYGSTFEGRTSPVSISSVYTDSREFGKYFFDCVMALCEDRELPKYENRTRLFRGGSCGCGIDYEKALIRETWTSGDSDRSFLSIHNMIQEDLMQQSTFRGFMEVVFSHLYQLDNICDFHLCLNENWASDQLELGYSDNMLHAIDYENYGTVGRISEYRLFDRRKLLEELACPHHPGKTYFFTPVFYENISFGFAVMGYGSEIRGYDRNYRLWISSISRGLEILRRTMELDRLTKMKDLLVNKKKGISDNSNLGEPAVAELKEEQKKELELTREILENNLLEYYFQPIVDARTGEIYSYESLMRTGPQYNLSPFKILYYAKLLQMVPTVEFLTFINVLDMMKNSEKLKDKIIFINGIPGIFLSEEEQMQIKSRLVSMTDRVVVEMTEAHEASEDQFLELKDSYRLMGIHYAVDDYGVGYSNVSNLLKYMPDVVKIDRSLISNIQKDANKQHFVREVIEFCRNSKIKSLAEGVETAEELRALIYMGVDYIQGYYTGRPAPDPINSIDPVVKNEIIRFHDEFERGELEKVYHAGRTNILNLGNLAREGYAKIVVGSGPMTYRDIEIIGNPGLQTEITLEVKKGYRGNITLDNVSFGSIKNRDCIELEPGTDLKLHLRGDNLLRKRGILVPEGASLTIEGAGNLRILLDSAEYFGIGNDAKSTNGSMEFRQDGEISIFANGQYGIGIGSGLGGKIHVGSGRYSFRINADEAVGIGAVKGDIDLKIDYCEIHMVINAARGVAIGSVYGDSNMYMENSSASIVIDGNRTVGFGSVEGKVAKLRISEVGISADIRSDQSTVVGSLSGMTLFFLERAAFNVSSSGKRALIFGGETALTTVRIENANVYTELLSEQARDTYASEDDFLLINGRNKFLVNGQEVLRKVL